MDVLILTSWYPKREDDYGGIFIRNQAQAISKKYNIGVVSVWNDPSKPQLFPNWHILQNKIDGFPVFNISVSYSIPVYNQFHFLRNAYKAIRATIKKKPRLIHAHVTYPSGIIAQYLSRYWKIPYIITEHRGPIETLFRSPIHKALTLRALNHADKVIAVSRPYRDDIRGYFNTPVEVVPNIINDKKFRISSKSAAPFTFGFLGGLNTNVKNLGLLLKAFKKLDNKKTYLYIGGSGKLLDSYRAQASELGISDRCCFRGKINPVQIQEFYNHLNALVISSRYESFNVSGVEAMACGLPVISTRCGGPEDYVNKSNGLLVPENDIDALVRGMKYVFENYSDYNPELIRSQAIDKFGAVSFMDKIERIYNPFVATNKHASKI